MTQPDVDTLLHAVRRHLWRVQGLVAVRDAAWVTAAALFGLSALHLAAVDLTAATALTVAAAAWLAAGARAAFQRPDNALCALWADRHLGGASAFGTLLDLCQRVGLAADDAAARRLRTWAQGRVPGALQQLGRQPAGPPLARALASMAVSAVLTVLVVSLGDPALAPAPTAATSAPDPAASAPAAQAAVDRPPDRVDALASALRTSAQPRPEDAGRRSGAAAAGAAGPANEPSADEGRPRTGANDLSLRPDTRVAAASGAAADRAAEQTPPPGLAGTPTAAARGGRKAGDGAGERLGERATDDPRAPGAVAAVALPTVRDVDLTAPQGADRRADAGQAASYDERDARQHAAGLNGLPTAPAATPPPKPSDLPLTPTEAHYVAAWLKAGSPAR